MVKNVSTKKYITRIGQKTGTSKISKKVKKNAINVDFIVESLKTNNAPNEASQIELPELELGKTTHEWSKLLIVAFG